MPMEVAKIYSLSWQNPVQGTPLVEIVKFHQRDWKVYSYQFAPDDAYLSPVQLSHFMFCNTLRARGTCSTCKLFQC
jgi:hypothetical protein